MKPLNSLLLLILLFAFMNGKSQEAEISINGKPLDTTYFKNGNIEKINYQFRQEKSFYESGQLKMIITDQGSRSYSEKGQLIYQSISQNPHVNSITEWYENGNLKAQGTRVWKYNKNTNEGNWVNSDDWMYWNKKGKEKQPTTKN
ncbi:hypothetical protein [Acidiluteibacter ferrifornacis]|uniref:MORN repeat variant n=1 Tax=Acidiluteibacter ferrifornacis TaxID=2692424 RepID=A0A6N9NN12_9FLAO|nr:hypothetical protein [Acidiluteibacter ferrifornacis]NBG67353.1 hypothetical protein [Acidiluteibacter ferrifornacis]